MTDSLLFIALYPAKNRLNEGFIQRIKEIDNLFSDCERIYLDIRFFSYFQKESIRKENVTIFHFHYLFHFFSIIRLINKSSRIYIHSVYSGFRIFPHIFFSRMCKAKVCFELHGTFEEELEYKGEKWNSRFFGWIERHLLRRAKMIVYVSRRFEKYYLQKYPFTMSAKRYVIPTCTSKVFEIFNSCKTKEIIERYEIAENDVVFVYAGSTEVWQKIDLMMEIIQKLIINNKYKFFLLTGNVENMIENATKFGIYPHKNLFILTVAPEELGNYYEVSHYGFVLRDDHILNEVSSPTKFLEYLYFGITPILKSTKIGDFTSFDIDYISIENIEQEFKPKKSEKNKAVAREILEEYTKELQNLKRDFLE
ncbi:MAG: glycosyltransferase [Candidatus Kapaibacteriota bacterium]